MRPFSLLIKPASADCNLQCEYCFYLCKSALYPATTRHRMTDDTLEVLIASYMATDQEQYTFGWQGGEPTLMGVEFFRRVTKLEQKHGRRGAVVANGLQTNATRIDNELARHLSKYRFLIGVSLDGPAALHDRFRKTASGLGSHAKAMEGIRTLARHKAQFNILTLVSSSNVSHGREVYRYLRDEGFRHHQYIPCVEFDPSGGLLPFAITGEAWGDFLCEVFDEWIAYDTRSVSVRLFDSVAAYLAEGIRNVCTMAGDCRQYFLVEYSGDVYPCDFYVEPALTLGNVHTKPWDEMLASPEYAAFGARKGDFNAACASCDYLALCMGDCPRHRPRTQADRRQSSALCAGWKRFYAHAVPRLKEIAREVTLERLEGRARPRT